MENFINIIQNNNQIVVLFMIFLILCIIALILFIYKKNFSQNITIIKNDDSENIKLVEHKATYKNGVLKNKYYLSKGKKHYKETFYYKSRELNKEQYWGNGILEGELYILSNYKNGKLNGSYIVYSKNGNIAKSYTYNDGVIING